MDTAKTSTLEGAATTVYAQGGSGNPRLIAWEGEKTLTFTIEDALLSDVSLAMLTGASMADVTEAAPTYVHMTFDVIASADNILTINDCEETFCVDNSMPAYAVILDGAGAVKTYLPKALGYTGSGHTFTYTPAGSEKITKGDVVRIDCYVKKSAGKIINIEAYKFAGYYYIEATTLFRDEETGQDFPAEFVIPRGKIQSNFTFTMAASGDPSTFTFTIDAFPAYTKFAKKDAKEAPTKVLAAIQVINDGDLADENTPHYDNEEKLLAQAPHIALTSISAATTVTTTATTLADVSAIKAAIGSITGTYSITTVSSDGTAVTTNTTAAMPKDSYTVSPTTITTTTTTGDDITVTSIENSAVTTSVTIKKSATS